MTANKAVDLSERRRNALYSTSVFAMIAVISGIYGFIYEIIFYYLNGDMKAVYWRGSHFLPWISIYAVGGIVIYFLTYRLKKNPLLVCLAGGVGCGVLEFLAGLALFYMLNGQRAWDYNTEKWNFGNIGGFICLRSVLIFALSSLLLVYVICPFLLFLQRRLGKKAFAVLAFCIAGVFIADFLYNAVITRIFPQLIKANDFYVSCGLEVLKYY